MNIERKKVLYKEVNGIIEKQCGECGEEFPRTEKYFDKDKRRPDGLQSTCKECHRKYDKKYREKNKERIKQYNEEHKEYIKQYKKKYHYEHKAHLKNIERKRLYNLSSEDYNKMLLEQNNQCSICGDELKTGTRGRAIDHCHHTGKVRGILCVKCNTTLGMYKDNIETFNSIITYLELHKVNEISVSLDY